MEPPNKNDFIIEYFIEDETLCDDLIGLHNISRKNPVDKSCSSCGAPVKKSTDTSYHVNWSSVQEPQIERIYNQLIKAAGLYSQTYPEAAWASTQVMPNLFNVQHYLPGEGYPQWHHEQNNASIEMSMREAVWMLYLNDVPDGGTEFKFQNRRVQAEKGKMVLWPAYFTHTHRGVVSETTEKYIATGWFSRTV